MFNALKHEINLNNVKIFRLHIAKTRPAGVLFREILDVYSEIYSKYCFFVGRSGVKAGSTFRKHRALKG
jgi:hypothetical protein